MRADSCLFFRRARPRFEQLARLSDPLPPDEVRLLLDVLPEPEVEAEPPQRRRKRMRSKEAEAEPLEVSGAKLSCLEEAARVILHQLQ